MHLNTQDQHHKLTYRVILSEVAHFGWNPGSQLEKLSHVPHEIQIT